MATNLFESSLISQHEQILIQQELPNEKQKLDDDYYYDDDYDDEEQQKLIIKINNKFEIQKNNINNYEETTHIDTIETNSNNNQSSTSVIRTAEEIERKKLYEKQQQFDYLNNYVENSDFKLKTHDAASVAAAVVVDDDDLIIDENKKIYFDRHNLGSLERTNNNNSARKLKTMNSAVEKVSKHRNKLTKKKLSDLNIYSSLMTSSTWGKGKLNPVLYLDNRFPNEHLKSSDFSNYSSQLESSSLSSSRAKQDFVYPIQHAKLAFYESLLNKGSNGYLNSFRSLEEFKI